MEQIGVKIQELIALYGLKIIAAVAILIIGIFTAKGIRSLILRLLRRHKVDETLVSFVTSLAYWGIVVFVIIAALGQLGVQTTSFIAVVALPVWP